MSIHCDWCGLTIARGNEEAFSLELVPFRPLSIAGGRRPDIGPTIVPSLHLHREPCGVAFLSEAEELAADHDPTEDELDIRITRTADLPAAEGGRGEGRDRCEEWRALPKYEQERRVLEAIGDERVTNAEVHRLLEEGDAPMPGWFDVAPLTRALFEAGELDREEGQFGRSRVRYSRKEPSPELRALGQTLKGGA